MGLKGNYRSLQWKVDIIEKKLILKHWTNQYPRANICILMQCFSTTIPWNPRAPQEVTWETMINRLFIF